MATGGIIERSDLNQLYGIVQGAQLAYPKEFIVGLLRSAFSEDSYYRYVSDPFGFPAVPSHVGLPLGSGIEDDTTTRLFIAESYHFDVIYFPAIIVKAGAFRSIPLSINREQDTIQYEPIKVIDGYGNETVTSIPTNFVFAGIWEGQINLDILCRDILARDELVSFCTLLFQDIRFNELRRAGILIKAVNAGSPTEGDDRQQEKLYKQSITLDIREEWRREIPIETITDSINFCIDFGRLDTTPPTLDPNMTISTTLQLVDEISAI